MQYKHSAWFMLPCDEMRAFCSQFISSDKLQCNKLIPAPVGATDAWKTAIWGTLQTEIPIEWSDTGFSFVTETPKMTSLFIAISNLNEKLDFVYKYASDWLGREVGNYNITCGKVMSERAVNHPAQFACAVWGLDYADFCSKRRGCLQVMAANVAKITTFVNGEEDELTDLDNILAEEDD